MFVVIYAVLCWGHNLRGLHVVFHVNNKAIFNTICSTTIWSAPTMKFIHHLIALARHLDFFLLLLVIFL